MSEQYLGEVRIMPIGYPPKGWAWCNGQIMSIQQNAALFALLGIQYGGNGTNNFALPDLRGRIPIGAGPGWVQAYTGGSETVTLQQQNNPAHIHSLMADSTTAADANVPNPAGAVLGQVTGMANPGGPFSMAIYGSAAANAALAGQSIGFNGGAPHENRQPFLALNYCIALAGIFPPRS